MTIKFLSRYGKAALRLFGLFLLTAGGYFLYLQATGNFATVVAGEVYRSSQPSAQSITELEKQYGIRTILNLRGKADSSKWYADEVQQAKSLNIVHINFKMSAGRELSPEKAKDLIAIMRDAPKPLLIHCRAGADRTGLASALYLAAVAGKDEEAAEGQLSLLYGHLPFPFSRAFAMDRTFEKLETFVFGNS